MIDGQRIFRVPVTLAVFMGALALGGCPAEPPPPREETARPAEIIQITSSDATSGLRFPGRVRAVQRAELAFNIPGQIAEFPVQEGKALAAGDLIARLEPSNFELRLQAARAEFDKARTDYERVFKIWEKTRAVAEAEVDQKRTSMEIARSSYAAARKDLDDTQLVAPFAGLVVRRYVENFQNIQAKEPIVSLQNLTNLEIVIHVPERGVSGQRRQVSGYAIFDGRQESSLPVTLKSFAAESDSYTQTYEVVLGFTRPEDKVVLPGMSAEVFLEDEGESTVGNLQLPLKAVSAGPDGQAAVWVVDPETSRVGLRPIEVGDVRGEEVAVLSGLQDGDSVVVSGVSHLRDGMLVRPL
ncbi:MAG: efflux RND transporter periplasmic adaptor subunit [Haliea sp.]